MKSNHAVNGEIREREVMLINEKGEKMGVVPTREALRIAYEIGLDLVAINKSNDVVICKILDYGKFKYELDRKNKEAAKKTRENRVELKEIQLRPTTDSNDIAIKAKRAQKFLDDGNKVKIVIKFKGREIHHLEIGNKVMKSFLSLIENYKFDIPISRNERQIIATIVGNKS